MFTPSLPLRDIMLIKVMSIKCSVFLQVFQCKFYICKLCKIISLVISSYDQIVDGRKINYLFFLVVTISDLPEFLHCRQRNKLQSHQDNWARKMSQILNYIGPFNFQMRRIV